MIIRDKTAKPRLGTPGKGLQLLLDGAQPQVTFKAFGSF